MERAAALADQLEKAITTPYEALTLIPAWYDNIDHHDARIIISSLRAQSSTIATKPFGWATWFNGAIRPDILEYSEDNEREAARRSVHPEYRVAVLYEHPASAPAIPSDVREGVANVILEEVDIASYEDYGGGALCNAPEVASAVLSYLVSIGWGPKE